MSSVESPSPLSSPTFPSNPDDMPPPLPEILSEQIRHRIFTHSSLLAKGHKHTFQAPEGDVPLDNEEFGHIGDQVFALAATDLIQELYPLLRVGPASKVRDCIKRKDRLAEICMSYELHTRLNVPEHQAGGLRLSQNVQVDVFKAYVGGLYRDQGAEVVSKWLMSLLRPHVKLAYQSVREAHLLPPETEAPSQLEGPAAYRPSPFLSTSFEGAGAAFPSYLPGFPRDYRQLTPPEASVPQQGPAQAGDGVGTCRAVNDKPRGRRRRRRSTLKDVGCEDAGEQGGTMSQPRSSTGLDPTDGARKRQKVEGRVN